MANKEFIYPIQARRERIQKAEEILMNMLPCDYVKALNVISLTLGLRLEKVREYLGIIIQVRGLINDRGLIRQPEVV